jgi:hypothetical protein
MRDRKINNLPIFLTSSCGSWATFPKPVYFPSYRTAHKMMQKLTAMDMQLL